MSKTWQDYQEQAASFFRSLGLTATVEAEVVGVRGVHAVDVYVEGSVFGIQFKWVVECKAWKTNVPKEKVLALGAIMQDVGADRGFLLSEKGFQAGAIRVAHATNLTLTSIEELQATVQLELVDATLAKLNWQADRLRERLWRLHKNTGDFMSEFMGPHGKVFVLQSALKDASKNDYPCVYAISATEGGEARKSAANFDELAAAAKALIQELEAYATAHEK